MAMLYMSFGEKSAIKFSSPLPKKNKISTLFFRAIINSVKLMTLALTIRSGGRVLIFAGAYASFYEKIFWATLIICTGRKPVIVSVDGNFPNFWVNTPSLFRWFFRKFIALTGVIFVCQSENWRKYYQQIFPGSNIFTVSATCAEDFFITPLDRVQSNSGKIKILYVGWVIHQKGIFDLLDAIAILSREAVDIRLDIVGPVFDKLSYWLNEVELRGLQSRVEFVGSVSSKSELIEAFDDCTIFVFPSHFEGFPVVLLEAIARGCPCIGTNIGGIPDILNDGKAGLIVEAHNPVQLADALLNLLDNPRLMDELSRNAFSRARDVYSHRKCIDSYLQILDVHHMSELSN